MGNGKKPVNKGNTPIIQFPFTGMAQPVIVPAAPKKQPTVAPAPAQPKPTKVRRTGFGGYTADKSEPA